MNHVDEQVSALQEKLELDDKTKDLLGEIELGVATRYTLADAIREGSTVSDQAYNWTNASGDMCAMSAAVVAAKARGYM